MIAYSCMEIYRIRDILIFLLQDLSFLMYVEKSVIQPCQKIEFLGIIVNPKEIIFPIPMDKVNLIMEQYLFFFYQKSIVGKGYGIIDR